MVLEKGKKKSFTVKTTTAKVTKWMTMTTLVIENLRIKTSAKTVIIALTMREKEKAKSYRRN